MSTAAHDPKRRALGKGLESLLPSRPAAPATVPTMAAVAAEPNGKPLEIPLDQIERNPFQTRTQFDETKLKELAESITTSGVVQPIVVRPLNPHKGAVKYQLITGERRWLASFQANKTTIPAIVRQVSDEQTLEMTIVENLQRADLNPMEQARAYQRLSQDFKLTQEQMAQRTGKERASVANFLRLLQVTGSCPAQSRIRRSLLRPRPHPARPRVPGSHQRSSPKDPGTQSLRPPDRELCPEPRKPGSQT